MKIPNLKDEVKDGKLVRFYECIDGGLWYITESGFVFPIPVEDQKGATFKNVDKAMLFMRWIRKHIDMLSNSYENDHKS